MNLLTTKNVFQKVIFAVTVMLFYSFSLTAQIVVTGAITDDTGAPVPGVNVMIRGTLQGVVTDGNGEYSITVPNRDAVIVFSFIGYVTQEYVVGNQTRINHLMKEDSQQLEEVVVVGYGTQRRTDITGSVATVDPNKLKERPVMNFAEALAGQMAGVHIQQISGMPGGEDLSVRIRGTSSITQSSEPLYVIDGFPVDGGAFRLVSPQDIESIQVLKDASSTAIYGSRGASGVVIITTKKGQQGKPRVSLTAQIGFQQREKEIKMMNRDQYVEWLKDGRNQAWLDQPLISGDPDRTPHTINDDNVRRKRYGNDDLFLIPDGRDGFIYNFHDPASVARMPDNNWQNLIFRNALIQQYDLSISGGSENTKYSISGSMVDQDGIVRGSDYTRYNFRTNISSQLTNFLEVGVNMNTFYGSGREIENGKDAPVMYALNLPPIYPVRNDDGTWGSMVRNQEILKGDVANPIAIAEDYYRFRKRYGWRASVYAEVKILEGLKYKISVNGSLQDSHRRRYLPSYLDLDGSRGPRIAESEDQRESLNEWVVEQTATYNKTFAQKHVVTLLGGYTTEKHLRYAIDSQMRNFSTDVIYTPTGGATLQSINGRFNIDWTMISYLARVNYVYDNKYIVTASIRRDGSSRFGKENRWGNFPSASVGWRISQEQFMQGLDFLSDMKLRASYGYVGNNRIGDFSHIGLLNIGYYPTGNAVRIAVNPDTMPNDFLGWEKSSQTNLGLDFSLFRGRIRFETEYYVGKSVDLLLNVQLPRITGYDRQMQNVGQVENKGMEFQLTTRNFVGEFEWTTDFNISFNRNKVLQLGPDERPYYNSIPNGDNCFITRIGDPIASMWGFVYEGVFKTQAELANSIHRSSDRVGDGKFKDVNKDGFLDANDKDIIGNNHPNYLGGLNNNFSYKNFSLNVQFTFSQGANIFAFWRRMCGIYHGDRNAIVGQLNRWRSESDPGDGWHFRPTRNPTGWQRDPSSAWIEDASFLRLRNLSLAYNFDRNIAQKLHLQGLRVFVTGQNLYTWTKYGGYDPEISTQGSEMTRGADYGGYPSARSFIFGVNLNF